MKKHTFPFYLRGAISTLVGFTGFYILLVIGSRSQIENFNYLYGFFLTIITAVFFTTIEIKIQINYRKKWKKADENQPWKAIVINKIIYTISMLLWFAAIGNIFVVIMKQLGFCGLPSIKVLFVATVLFLNISCTISVLYHFYFEKFRSQKE